MPVENLASLSAALLPSVLEAGAAEMRHYRAGVAVEVKADDSPVTAADREAEAILLEGLARAAPGVPVVAEEAVSDGRLPEIKDEFFLVDPLDGTREFIHKRGEFTVNVALIAGGTPVFGIVYAPALGELYVTLGTDRAAFARLQPDGILRMPHGTALQPIRVRQPNPHALTAVASRSHMTPRTSEFLTRYPVAECRNAGSSLKFGLLARGQADLYPRLGPTMEWDTAAGHAVLLAAGGTVTTLDGAPLKYGKSGFRNPDFVAWGASQPLPPGVAA